MLPGYRLKDNANKEWERLAEEELKRYISFIEKPNGEVVITKVHKKPLPRKRHIQERMEKEKFYFIDIETGQKVVPEGLTWYLKEKE